MPFVNLATMHEHHMMAKEYGIHPALTWGVDPLQEQLLGYQLMRATFYGGRAVENRMSQMKRVLEPMPEQPPKGSTWGLKNVWTYSQAVGLESPPAEADEASDEAIAERALLQQREVAPETADLLRGLAASDHHNFG